jgi:capsular polysaccharide biosynthesis protein
VTEMELTEMWIAVRRRLWVVIMMVLIAGASAGALCRWYLPKAYSATATLMVLPGQTPSIDYLNTLVTGQQMVSTYAALATSPTVLSRATRNLTNVPTVAQLTSAVNASAETGTDLMTLTVRAARPDEDSILSNAIANTLTTTVSKVTGQHGLEVVAAATPNTKPVSPRTLRTTAAAAGLAIILGLMIVYMWNALDDAIRREEEIASALSCRSLGVVSTIPVTASPPKHVATAPERSPSL